MNEIEREAVLTDRFEKRKALNERREARRKAREAEGKKSSKDTRTLSGGEVRFDVVRFASRR